MLLYLICCALARTTDALEKDIHAKLDSIDKKLKSLKSLGKQIDEMNPGLEKESPTEVIQKTIILYNIDTERTDQFNNIKIVKDQPNYQVSGTCFMATSSAPIFEFRANKVTVARKVTIGKFNECKCLPQMLSFQFFRGDEMVMESKMVDLAKSLPDGNELDLETEIIFDTMKVNVWRNHGDPEKTCLPHVEVWGPKL